MKFDDCKLFAVKDRGEWVSNAGPADALDEYLNETDEPTLLDAIAGSAPIVVEAFVPVDIPTDALDRIAGDTLDVIENEWHECYSCEHPSGIEPDI